MVRVEQLAFKCVHIIDRVGAMVKKKMPNVVGFSDRFAEVIDNITKKTKEEYAEKIGVDVRTLDRYATGSTSPSVEVVEKISETTGYTLDWLIKGNGPKLIREAEVATYRLIPKVTVSLSAGNGSLVVDELIEGYYSFRSAWLSKKGGPEGKVLVDIVGDSMIPDLQPGDWVMLDTKLTSIINGHIYAVRIGSELVIKEVNLLSGNKIELVSRNDRYKPQEIEIQEEEPTPIIGKVVWQCRDI